MTVSHLLAAFLLLAALAGCMTEGPAPMDDSTMVDVLVELHLLNAREEVTGRPVIGARDSIFHRYGTDSTAYAQSMAYLARHPDVYSDLYNDVVDELAAERTTITAPDSGLRPQGQPLPSP